MNWKIMESNQKGFVNHPETPVADKNLFLQSKAKAYQLLQIWEKFIPDGVLRHRNIAHMKEELCANSRFLHRGIYCPSPVLDILINNAKRGKILRKPSERSNITHRYIYDSTGRLAIIDNYLDRKMVSSEYLLYHEDLIYGVTVGMSGRLVCISEEQYSNSHLNSYLCAYYSGTKDNVHCYQMDCEYYQYDEHGLSDWNYYQFYFDWGPVGDTGFIRHNRYTFLREDGWLKAFARVNIDGTPIAGSILSEIKVKRKA